MCSQDEVFNIFTIKWDFSEIFFKEFFKQYNFPDLLNSTHTRTMIVLDHNGPCTMTKASCLMELEKGSFTPVAKKLVEYNYIKKVQNRDDKRVYELVLTEKGSEYVKEFKEEHLAYIKKSLENFSPEDQESYFDLLKKVNSMNARLRESMGIKY